MKQPMEKPFDVAVDSLSDIARSYHYAGNSSLALKVLHASIQLPELSDTHLLKLLLMEGKIRVFEYLSTNHNPELMFATLRKTRQLTEEVQDRKRAADSLSLLGIAHYFADLNASASVVGTQEKYKEALDYQQQALQIRDELGDSRGISESLFHIGTVFERWQEIEKALHFYTQAFEIADLSGHIFEKSEPVRHFAYNALIKGDLDQALYQAQLALELRQQSGFMPYQPLDHLLLSDIYLKRVDLENAQLHADKALALANKMGYQRYVSSSLLTLGDIMASRQETVEAVSAYEEALRLAQDLQIPLLVTRAMERLGLGES
ncbi:tetratricopeptide repeat protein [Paenibacillus terrigena]|uniref:tetratricopeptide repeat protein n=1 Tax=Paenibacillus terrigena TaxID=369333 RepID=UPI000375A441|nr:tetratricopeptide repeat protein [Paenibacillus terrigena]